jgi:hypothetical protein
MVDDIRIGDEVIDEFRVGERVHDECTGATVCHGGLVCRLNVVFSDAEVVVWNEFIQNDNVVATGWCVLSVEKRRVG